MLDHLQYRCTNVSFCTRWVILTMHTVFSYKNSWVTQMFTSQIWSRPQRSVSIECAFKNFLHCSTYWRNFIVSNSRNFIYKLSTLNISSIRELDLLITYKHPYHLYACTKLYAFICRMLLCSYRYTICEKEMIGHLSPHKDGDWAYIWDDKDLHRLQLVKCLLHITVHTEKPH